jgi:hypothetical protein
MPEWKSKLERLLRSADDRNADTIINEICDLAAEMGDSAAEALLEQHPDLFELTGPLAEARLRNVHAIEVREAEHLFAQRFERPVSFAEVASAYGVDVYRNLGSMFDVVDFRDCRHVVMVGCGRVPYTSFYIHDHADVPEIVGVDTEADAVAMANALAARLGYTRFRAEVGDGRSYDYSQAQVVFATSYVSGKAAMLSRIADTAPENVQIAAREPYSLGRLWTESYRIDSEPRLELVARGSGWSHLSRGLYLKRRRATAATEA